jgi:hypothetical protein
MSWVIDPEFTSGGVVDLVAAVQRASRATANMNVTPPFSRSKIGLISAEWKGSYLNIFEGSVNLLPRLDRLWFRWKQVAIGRRLSFPQMAWHMSQSSQARIARGMGVRKALSRTETDLAS